MRENPSDTVAKVESETLRVWEKIYMHATEESRGAIHQILDHAHSIATRLSSKSEQEITDKTGEILVAFHALQQKLALVEPSGLIEAFQRAKQEQILTKELQRSIKIFGELFGYDQKDLAGLCEISPAALSAMLKNQTGGRIDNENVIHFFDYCISRLRKLKGNRKTQKRVRAGTEEHKEMFHRHVSQSKKPWIEIYNDGIGSLRTKRLKILCILAMIDEVGKKIEKPSETVNAQKTNIGLCLETVKKIDEVIVSDEDTIIYGGRGSCERIKRMDPEEIRKELAASLAYRRYTKEFDIALKNLLTRLKMTQAQLSRETGISAGMVCKLLQNSAGTVIRSKRVLAMLRWAIDQTFCLPKPIK